MNHRPEIELPMEDGMFVLSIEDGSWAEFCRFLTRRRTDGLVFEPEDVLNLWARSNDPTGPIIDRENGIVRIPVQWVEDGPED